MEVSLQLEMDARGGRGVDYGGGTRRSSEYPGFRLR